MQVCLVIDLLAVTAQAADTFQTDIAPFLRKYCVECHNRDQAKGELDVSRFNSEADVVSGFRRWNHIIEFIRGGEMPPEKAPQPSIEESRAVVESIRAILIAEAAKSAGDPGIILPRRLSHTEYDHAVRDLTGVDIRPTKDFPADPAGGEGFDNTGEALGMSPNLVKKYLAAAQLVADHLVLKTNGISFAPFPVTSYNERKKLTEQAIIDFYESHTIDLAAYIEGAWRYRFLHAEDTSVTLESFASQSGLSPRYLARVWQTLNTALTQSGVLGDLGRLWAALPPPQPDAQRPAELQKLIATVELWRRVLGAPQPELIRASAGNWPISHLDFRAATASARDQFSLTNLKNEVVLKSFSVPSPGKGDQNKSFSLFLRIDSAFASGNEWVSVKRPLFSRVDRYPNKPDEDEKNGVVTLRSLLEETQPALVAQLGFGKHPQGMPLDEDSFVLQAPALIEIPLTVEMQRRIEGRHWLVKCQLDPQTNPAGSVFVQHSLREPPRDYWNTATELLIVSDSPTNQSWLESASLFCDTFPNRFFYVDRGRGLAAGFHLVEGFFRDDQPLVSKVLSHRENKELDQLWRELDFVTESAETLLRGFVWFERSEREVLHDSRFDFLRAEDPALVEDEMLERFEKLYLDKLGVKRLGDTLQPEQQSAKYASIHRFFSRIRDGLKLQRQLMDRAEAKALLDMKDLARRAYRRNLTEEQQQSLEALYASLRAQGQTSEQALRGTLIAILMSPDFCYHYYSTPEGDGVYPLSDFDLASRLSTFLWSSLPDEELQQAAEGGKLQREEELLAQSRRMLRDDRISAFATEFFGQWLRYRDFLSKDTIGAAAFPDYDLGLREAIFEEPMRLATHLIQSDLPITQLLDSDMTFVNQRLAKHYGGAIELQYRHQLDKLGIGRADKVRDGQASEDRWLPVSGLRDSGRGGLLGMAIIHAKNSAGERTSPVKRGFWTIHHLLGQHFPPPPANVPELPKSERAADRTIRELLAAHVADTQCSMCHRHFDSLGLAMEGFDTLGRQRAADSAGRPIDNVVTFPSGQTAKGVPGLMDYIREHRTQDFVQTMSRKFLGYALGRSVQLSDQPLLDDLEMELKQHDYRFSVLFERLILSPQFRQQRGGDTKPVVR